VSELGYDRICVLKVHVTIKLGSHFASRVSTVYIG
jgi:hypothetical protein